MNNETEACTGWNICPKAYQGCPGPIESKKTCMNICSKDYQGCHDSTIVLARGDFIALQNFTGCGTDLTGFLEDVRAIEALEATLIRQDSSLIKATEQNAP